jgi:hypothetical protein
MKNLIFACVLSPGEYEQEALRLARSIRTFGGEFCFNPIWLLSRQSSDELSEATRQEINSLGLKLIPFEVDDGGAGFPFASYVTGAAIAESLAQGEASFLAMMAGDTLVLQPPHVFLLPTGKNLGACPVHLKNLGSGYHEPLNEFWRLIYHACKVDPDQAFEMHTVVDNQPVRTYFNAGLLVVRPERGFLRNWQANFQALYNQSEFAVFYKKDELFSIYMHQAVLAASLSASMKPAEFQQFPFEVNYPLHLHSTVDKIRRPKYLNDLITCRYEEFTEIFASPGFCDLIQVDQPVKAWLEDEIARCGA